MIIPSLLPVKKENINMSRNYMEMRRKESDWRNELLATQKEKLRLLMTLWEAEKAQWQ